MRPISIVALRPNVTQEEAVREFSSRGLSSMYWRMTAGRLQRIAEVYVPYQFYEVSYVMARARQTRLFAMDAVDGSLDLFEFPQLPSRQQLVTTDTRNRVEMSLAADAADELLREKALRVIFQQGFFKVREASLNFYRKADIVHLPYWLGFYSSGEVVRCRVLDAVRRRIEGAKASAFFEQWLTA
ncbi:MAG TPA: hypothetical protein VN850_03795 [Candidatus Acidoferrales bacterium]|nr:hypothetical protein [Candidatus Acidoferrales bacterium]